MCLTLLSFFSWKRVYAFSAFSLSFHKDYRLMFPFFCSDSSLLIFVDLAVLGLRCCISLAAVSGVCLLWSRGQGPPWAQYLQLAASGAQAQSLWCLGLVAPRHVGSSWTRDQTHVLCIGRQILNHWPPKKVLFLLFFNRICLISLMMSSMHRRFTCICFCMSLWYWNNGGGDFRFLFCYPLLFMTPASPNLQLDLNPWDTCFHFSLFLYFLFLFWKSSVPFSHSVMSDFLRPHESQHTRPPCLSPTPRVYSNPCPSSRWCHPTLSSSVVPFSSCSQSLPASGLFPMSQLFAWGGQSIGVSVKNLRCILSLAHQ